MVSLSAILPSSALALLIAALAMTQVDAHGYIYIPESEFTSGSATSAWIVQIDPVFASDDWDGNTDASVTVWKTLAAENSVTDIRTLLDSDTTLYGADCGYTNPDADAKTPPTDGTATFSRGIVHVGPCEIWLDDTKVLSDDNCEATYGGDVDVKSIFPIDYSSCSSSGCMLRFYWLAFQGIDGATVWQVYKDCVPLTGGTSSTSTTTTTTSSVSSEAETSSSSATTATTTPTTTTATPTTTTATPTTTTSTPSSGSFTAPSSGGGGNSSSHGGWSGGFGGPGAHGQSFGF